MDRPADFAWKPALGCPAHTASGVPCGAAERVTEMAPICPHRTWPVDQVFPPSPVNQNGARAGWTRGRMDQGPDGSGAGRVPGFGGDPQC